MKHIKEYKEYNTSEQEEINTEPSIEEIDSHDLEMLSIYGDDPERYKEEAKEFSETPEEEAMNIARISHISNLLKGKIEYGEFFDHKEFDAKVWPYLKRKIRGRRVYNAYPGGDGIHIVFSKIELPAAEEIDPVEYEEAHEYY